MFAGGLRGAAAATDIGAGEVVVSVPRELLISTTTAKQSDLVGQSPLPAVPTARTSHSTRCFRTYLLHMGIMRMFTEHTCRHLWRSAFLAHADICQGKPQNVLARVCCASAFGEHLFELP